MRIARVGRFSLSDVPADCGLVVAASGYETRARHVAEALGAVGALRVSVGFDEHKDAEARKKNDEVFLALGYEPRLASGGDGQALHSLLSGHLSHQREEGASALVDISSMTRPWCGAMVRALMESKSKTGFRMYFAYSPAQESQEKRPYPASEVAGPVPGFMALAPPDRPTALVVGLGFDGDRALGLCDLVDPARVSAFLTGPGLVPDSESRVRRENAEILKRVRAEDIVLYPLRQPDLALCLLDSVCGALCRDYRVVITSVGPKMFGVICLLVAGRYPDVSVWRVSAGSREPPIDRQPTGEVCGLWADWVPT
jgi:hypothetical protein